MLRIKSIYIKFIPFTLSLVVPVGCLAQTSYVPLKVPNKDVDQFGVEVKSGSYSTTSPEIVGVGDGPYRLSYYYTIADWNNSLPNYNGILNIRPSENAIRVAIGGTSETFYSSFTTSELPNTVAYEPYLKNGSILYREQNGSQYTYVYVMKDATKVFFSPITNENSTYPSKIIYPSGYEITLGSLIRDNKGYAIQATNLEGGYGANLKAINLTKNYCSDQTPIICQTDYERAGSTNMPSYPTRTISNPMGEVTKYTYSSYQFQVANNAYEIVVVPIAVDMPSGPVNEIKISYNYGQANVRLPSDLLITKIESGNINVDYTYDKVGIPTQGYASPGYHITTISKIGNERIFEAYSVMPPSSAVSSPRTPTTMLSYKDGSNNITTFSSDRFGRVVGATLPSGVFTTHTFDNRNNYTSSSTGGPNVATLVTTRVFPASCSISTQATCNQPTSITDPRGNTTDYTYNSRGQLLTVTYPAASAGAVRGKVTYTYEMRTAYVKDAAGGIIAAGPPISMLVSEQSCKTLTSCASSSDEVIKLYDYGPTSGLNNLQLRGIGLKAYDGQGNLSTRWTCYQYNYFGDRISETNARAGATSCS